MTARAQYACIRMRVLCAALLAAFPLFADAGIAGHFQFVAGEVRIVGADNKERLAQKGREVNEGETLLSGPGASAQLKMIDGGLIALRPESHMKVDSYVFHGVEDGKEKARFSLLKGGFRAVTGLIGRTHKENYSITTETATIGIRGTDHEPFVILPPPPGVQASNPPGTYDKVNVGATTLATLAGTAVISSNQVGYAAAPNQPPVILPKVPDFFQPARTTPQAKQEPKKDEKQEAGKQDSAKQEAKSASTASGGSTSGSGAASSTASAAADSPVRASAPSDTAQLAAVTSVATAAPAVTSPIVAAAPANMPLTGSSSSGTTLNTSTQTLTTSSGTTEALIPTSTTVPTTTYSPGATIIATSGGGSWFSYAGGGNLSLSTDGSGQLIGATAHYDDYAGLGSTMAFSVTGGTLMDSGKDAATSLAWGRWQGGQLTLSSSYLGQDASGKWGMGATDNTGAFIIGNSYTNTSALGATSAHWITGHEAYPGYLAQVLTGTATYSLLGGTRPTDSLGNVGTLNNATLAANFTAQTVDAGVDFTVGGNNWVLQGNGLVLNGGSSFYASSCAGCASNTLNTFSKNGTPMSTSGYSYANLNGQLLGTGLNGAALMYSVSDNPASGTGNTIQGVAGFSGAAQNTATAYRLVGVEDGFSGLAGHYGAYYAGSYYGYDVTAIPGFSGTINPMEAPASRVVDSSAGLTEFIGAALGYAPVATATSTTYASAATIRIGTAVNRDVGATTIDGMPVSWGRWEGGSVDIYTLDGAAKLGTIANANKSIHWITSGTLTGPVEGSLPLTGTASYTLAGNTNPTDFKGNAGTLGSATLNADFSRMLVNASVTANFNSATNNGVWSMTANNLPIDKKGGFSADSSVNGANGIALTATCTGTSCGSQTNGAIGGNFVGTAAAGAVLSYRMATGSTATAAGSAPSFVPTNGVVGLAVFKK